MNCLSQVGFAVLALAAALFLTGCKDIPKIVYTTCDDALQGPFGKGTMEGISTVYAACKKTFTTQRQITLCTDAGSTFLDNARAETSRQTKEGNMGNTRCAEAVAKTIRSNKVFMAALFSAKDNNLSPEQTERLHTLVNNYVKDNQASIVAFMRSDLNDNIEGLVSRNYNTKYKKRQIPSTVNVMCGSRIAEKLSGYQFEMTRSFQDALVSRCNAGAATFSGAINNDIDGTGIPGTPAKVGSLQACKDRCTANLQCQVCQYSSTDTYPKGGGGDDCFIYGSTNFFNPPSTKLVESFRMYTITRGSPSRCMDNGGDKVTRAKTKERHAFIKKCAEAAFDSMCPKGSACAIETSNAPLELASSSVETFLNDNFHTWMTTLKANLKDVASNVDNNWGRLFNMFTLPDSQSGTLLAFVSLVAVVAAIGSFASAVRFVRNRATRTVTPVASRQELQLLTALEE